MQICAALATVNVLLVESNRLDAGQVSGLLGQAGN